MVQSYNIFPNRQEIWAFYLFFRMKIVPLQPQKYKLSMKQSAILLVLATLLACSCGKRQHGTDSDDTAVDSLGFVAEGDSTIYGLTCDGTNDTILVFLPLADVSADPDTFNVLAATKRHRIFGHPKVGDRIAVVRNVADSTTADFVIVMENLNGSWAYQVMPTLKQRADMTEKQILTEMTDSFRQALMVPREYGMQIMGDNTIHSIGTYRSQQDAAESPVEYPKTKRYRQWRLYNGQLLLTAMGVDSLGNSYVTDIDTADFIMLRRDTLVLKFKDQKRGYYRKEDPQVNQDKKDL